MIQRSQWHRQANSATQQRSGVKDNAEFFLAYAVEQVGWGQVYSKILTSYLFIYVVCIFCASGVYKHMFIVTGTVN